MIKEEELLKQLDIWQERVKKYSSSTPEDYGDGYRDAYLECISDIAKLLLPTKDKVKKLTPKEEEEYIQDMLADAELSSMEYHENYYN